MKTALNLISLALIVLLVALAAIGFIVVPASAIVPAHWDHLGQPNGYLPRTPALLAPLVTALAMTMLYQLALRFGGTRTSLEGLRAVLPGLLLLFVVIEVGIILIGLGVAVEMMRLVTAAVAVLVALIGLETARSMGSSPGLRLPRAGEHPAAQIAARRTMSMASVTASIVLIVVTVVTGHPIALLVAMTLSFVLPLLLAIIAAWHAEKAPPAHHTGNSAE